MVETIHGSDDHKRAKAASPRFSNHNTNVLQLDFGLVNNAVAEGPPCEAKILSSPPNMYGRIAEQRQLLEAYRASQNTKAPQSVVAIINGAAGSGKTALIKSLREHIRNENGSMFCWVFDRQSLLQIGPGFNLAMENWTSDILALDKVNLEKWKAQALHPLNSFEISMLVSYIPCLKP